MTRAHGATRLSWPSSSTRVGQDTRVLLLLLLLLLVCTWQELVESTWIAEAAQHTWR